MKYRLLALSYYDGTSFIHINQHTTMAMMLRILLAVFVLSACQTGKIPCPRVKTAKLNRSHPGHRPYSTLIARAETEVPGNKPIKTSRISEDRFIDNVSEEEWDCPQPGGKKYLPRHVRENIKRNFKKMNQEKQQSPADSTRTN